MTINKNTSMNGVATNGVTKNIQDEVPDRFGNFDRVVGPMDVEYANSRIAKWQSRTTGLSVVWVDTEGPLVNGYFTVATEIFDDSGCPHTLEHLIFLGSEKYPYKGILDSLANRAFARGTNAWTDTTHTAYTVTTAGSEGFLRLLPVYLDHVLYPTITSSGYVTEVHHINGKGEDAGVVYSEMQGRENGSGDLMALKSQRAMFKQGSGYRSETGGLMEALRVLNVEKIREYHSTYYQPHNLVLVVTGKVSPTALLETLQNTVEPSIIAHKQAHGPSGPPGWKRPFLETGSKGGGKVEKPEVLEIEFPEKDEGSGEVQISWVGPNTNDFLADSALDLLTTYLSDSAVSPLAKEFIEIPDPLCTDITFYPTDGEKSVMTAYLSSVPSASLATLPAQFLKAITTVVTDGIDMTRMSMVIERSRQKLMNQMEVDSSDTFSTEIISDFLYGDKKGVELRQGWVGEMKRYETLRGWSSARWGEEMKKWLVDNPSLTVIGRPSAALADKLDADTKARLEANKETYGPEGLKKLAETLANAQAENDREVPNEVLANFPVPSLDGIRWIDVESATAAGGMKGPVQEKVDKDSAELPVFVQFDHVESNFLSLHVYLSPRDLPAELATLLPIYLESFFSLPVNRADGTSLSFEQVVEDLDRETVEYNIHLGSPLSQTLEISLKVEKSKYAPAVRWLRDLMWGSKFDAERLQVITAKIVQSLPSSKRDGSYIVDALDSELLYDPKKAPSLGMNLLRQDEEVPKLLTLLKEDPQKVVKGMEELRKHLLKVESMRISITGNIMDLEKPKTTFLECFQKLEPAALVAPLLGKDVLGASGAQPSGKAVVCSMSTIESSFAYHVGRGPQGYDHPDLPALTAAIAVLNAMESYLWKYIRGAGLAYGCSIKNSPEAGHVSLRIYKSPDSAKAFAEASRVLKDLVAKKIKMDDLVVESAKSSMAFSTAQLEASVGDAAYQSFANQALKGLPQKHQRNILAKANDATTADVLAAIEKYLLPMLDPKTSYAVVASGVTKSEPISVALTAAGFTVERRELASSGDADGDDESASGGSAMDSEI